MAEEGEKIIQPSSRDSEMMHRFTHPEIIGPEIKKQPSTTTTFVDRFLGDIRAGNAENQRSPYQLEDDSQINAYATTLIRRKPVLVYLTDFFNESINDTIDNKSQKREKDAYKKMHDTAASLAAGIQVDEGDHKQIKEYIDTQYTYWKNRAALSQGQERQLARENQGIFRAFQIASEKPVVLEEKPPIQTLQEKKDIHEQPEFPNFSFRPDKADEFLTTRQKEKVNPTLLKGYLMAAKEDIEREAEHFKNENAPFIEAITTADHYYKDHKNEQADIAVIIENGGIVYCGTKNDIPSTEGQVLLFTPTEYMERPHSLARYKKRRDEAIAQPQDAQRAVTFIQQLEESNKPITDPNDLIAVIRILELHKTYLATLDDGTLNAFEKKKITTHHEKLDAFSLLVKNKTVQGIMPETSNTARRFFRGAKAKWKQLRER